MAPSEFDGPTDTYYLMDGLNETNNPTGTGPRKEASSAKSNDGNESKIVVSHATHENQTDAHHGSTHQSLDKDIDQSNLNKGPLFRDLVRNCLLPLGKEREKGGKGLYHRQYQIVSSYLGKWRTDFGPFALPLLRILLPTSDRSLADYQLGEAAITDWLIRALGLSPINSSAAKTLRQWKLSAKPGEDFAAICLKILVAREGVPKPAQITVYELDRKLSSLARADDQNVKQALLRDLYCRMSSEELVWCIRLLLKNMRLGIYDSAVLRAWHTDAYELYLSTSDLNYVCTELLKPQIPSSWKPNEVRPNFRYRTQQPYLAITVQDAVSKMLKGFEDLLLKVTPSSPCGNSSYFMMEEKCDGVRMQLHLRVSESTRGRGGWLTWWSREGTDYTAHLGDAFGFARSRLPNPSASRFSSRIVDCFASGVAECVFDGEMLVVDTEKRALAPFGFFREATKLQFSNEAPARFRPLYQIFDILHLNGKSLTQYTLYDRIQAVTKVITPPDGDYRDGSLPLRLQPQRIGRVSEDVSSMLSEVAAQHGEGLVLKCPLSTYTLGGSSHDWIKLKPELLYSDLYRWPCLILGAFYGNSGRVSSYLCAVLDSDVTAETPLQQTRFQSAFCLSVGLGQRDHQQIDHLTGRANWFTGDSKQPSIEEYYDLHATERKPDAWIAPQNSVVVYVRGIVIPSSHYRCVATLRFPAFVGIASGQSWRSTISAGRLLRNLHCSTGDDSDFTSDDSSDRDSLV